MLRDCKFKVLCETEKENEPQTLSLSLTHTHSFLSLTVSLSLSVSLYKRAHSLSLSVSVSCCIQRTHTPSLLFIASFVSVLDFIPISHKDIFRFHSEFTVSLRLKTPADLCNAALSFKNKHVTFTLRFAFRRSVSNVIRLQREPLLRQRHIVIVFSARAR